MFKWIKRLLIILGIVFVAVLVLAFIFISPITKYVIEKYDKEFTNREITIDKLWLNILTGTFHISNLTVYEENGKDQFVTAADINLEITVRKLLVGEYDVKQATFKSLKVNLIVDGTKFNFDDIIKKFASTDTLAKKEKAEPVKYWLHNFSIENSTITSFNKQIGNRNEINNLMLSGNSIAWDNPEMLLDFAFAFASGGNLKGNFKTNMETLAYKLIIDVQKFDLHAWYPYLKDIMNTKALEGNINTNLFISGNFNEPQAIAASGKFNISDLAIVDPKNTTLISCNSFDVGIDSVNVKNGLYNLSNISFNTPYLLFDIYDNGNNFSRLFNDTTVSTAEAIAAGEANANIFSLLVGQIKDITKNYVVTDYNSDKVVIQNGHVLFNDYTLPESYKIDLEDMKMNAENLRSSNERIKMQAFSTLNQSGKAVINFGVNPQDFDDFDLNIAITDLRVSDFNPYFVHYVAFPFSDGIIEYNTTTSVKNHFLKSSNNLVVLHAELGKKANEKPLYSLPMKLAISLLKDVKGNIKIDIPVAGDLSDPKYKIGKVIWQIIKNLLMKAATAPFKLLANLFSGKEEELKEIVFEYRQPEFSTVQQKQFDNIQTILKHKPDLNVELIQVNNMEAEKEFQAIYEVKKQYYFQSQQNSSDDSLSAETITTIKNIDIRDTLFIAFVNSKVADADGLTPIHEKCRKIIGEPALEIFVADRMEYRNALVANYLHSVKLVPLNRFRIINTPDQKAANTQQLSKYLINYFVDEQTDSLKSKAPLEK